MRIVKLVRLKIRACALLALTAGAVSPALALGEQLECVPYARELSGIQIRGDAHSWWDQAAERYVRSNRPRTGAVLSFRPQGNMRLGHVAVVSRIIDPRRVLVSHANWSTIDGRRGHIETDVPVEDVSERNDWSRVRVWYAPIGKLGTTAWPVNGFIYPDRADRAPAKSLPSPQLAAHVAPVSPVSIAGRADDPIGDLIARSLN